MLKIFRKKIGIIGYGNMGSAIGSRIKDKYRLYIFDKDAGRLTGLSGGKAADSCVQLADKADVIILAVKPQDFDDVLNIIKDKIGKKLVISIAAGITTRHIEGILDRTRVIRVMPNIGAFVGSSLTCLCKGQFAKGHDLKFAVGLFNRIGITLLVAEEMMDAATAVGGSGPGFWGFLFGQQSPDRWGQYEKDHFIPEFTRAAKAAGFDEEKAVLAAKFVSFASRSVLEAMHLTPQELTDRVASKGGTTEAGLSVLRNGGTLTQAVQAAALRAHELSRGA